MKVLTAKDFCRIGARLGGNQWKPVLAKALRCSPRTIERYAAGEANLPPERRTRLALFIALRMEELGEDYDVVAG